jgi:hypothetical protein
MELDKEIRPAIKAEMLEAMDPSFEAGSTHTARAQLTNPTAKQFTYTVELYLGVGKVATSGQGQVTIGAGASQLVDFTLVTPQQEGTHHVYLDVSVAGSLIAHYLATEDVSVVITPAINVGPITWS